MAASFQCKQPTLRLGDRPTANFNRFETEFRDYLLLSGLGKQGKEYQMAALRQCMGEEEERLYQSLVFTDTEDKNDVNTVVKKLKAIAVGTINETYERYKFNTRNQKEDEGIEAYYAELRILAKTCNFDSIENSLIRDRIVVGIKDNNVRKSLLERSDLTLEKTIEICKATERTKEQMEDMKLTSGREVNESTVNRVKTTGGKPKINANKFKMNDYHTGRKSDNGRARPTGECWFCGTRHKFLRELCPAYGQTCAKCQGENHFAKMCDKVRKYRENQKKRESVHQMNVYEEDYEEDYYEDEYEEIMMVSETKKEK